MTWQQMMDYLTSEIGKHPMLADEPALVWLCENVEYEAGEHEVESIDLFNQYGEPSNRNRLSMNLSYHEKL